MQQHHGLTIKVGSDGKVDVHVEYREAVPDLISKFPPEVQRLARRWFWWPTQYERDVWSACLTLAPWARATVHQHILHERALWVTAMMRRRALRQQAAEERRRANARRPSASRKLVLALQRAWRAGRTKGLAERARAVSVVRPLGVDRLAAGTALASTSPGALSLTEQLAQQFGTEPAHPREARNIQDHSRRR